jgi:hypothetical protein
MNEKTAQLRTKVDAAFASSLIYSTFQHYRGGIYYVDSFAVDTDDGELRVIYQRVGGPDYDMEAEAGIQFARPLREFLDEVVVMVDDQPVRMPRFRPVKRVDTWVPIDDDVESA